MRSLSTLLPTLLIVAWLAGCAVVPPVPDPPPLDGTAWVLEALPGVELAEGAPATVRFEGGRAAGSDGCNRFSAGYTAQGATFDMAPGMASTRMACAPAVTRQAQAFTTALAGARAFRIEGARLHLLGADGAWRATLAAQSQGLPGTRWRVTGIYDGRGAVASVVAGSNVTLSFAADGQAGGSAGCNRYTARYESDGGQLRLQPAAATRRMCPGEALMAQEQAFLRTLESVATMRIEGDRLELRTAAGALAVSLVVDRDQ
jgi:heat shock protein HslJ